jgi:hypothetical protein
MTQNGITNGTNGHGLNGHARETNDAHLFDTIDDSVAAIGPPTPLTPSHR